MGKKLREKLKKLPVERQKRIARRAKELIAQETLLCRICEKRLT